MTAPKVLRDDLLAGRRALVTGAGTGIGRGIALRLIELGANVVGVGRHAESLEETAHLAAELDGDFEVAVGDVRDVEAITGLVERVGEDGLDILVNNAGGQFFARAEDITPGGWRAVIELNLDAVFTLTTAAYPFLSQRGGAVVNISLSGVERGGMGMAHSIAARSGVLGLTRTLALEWARDRIRVNCLGPGTVMTPALGNEAEGFVRDALIGRATPMRRATEVEEVAEVVAFLCSPATEMMTGQMIQVDGAAHLGPGLHMLPEVYR